MKPGKLASMSLLIVIVCAMSAMRCGAQTPRLIHYDGRLTTASNVPITVPTTVYFSLWQGGTATVASQTTELYREVVTITPDVNGLFSHDVGSTPTVTIQLGALTASIFNTAQPVYLQVAIGAVGNVTLPRARVTSVGYAFIANNATGDITPHTVGIQGVGTVINSSGQWVGGGLASALPGTPVVSSLGDVTGGNVVVGDFLQMTGSGLAGASVQVGGKPAPIINQSASQITFQVPAGVPSGVNTVTVVAGGSGPAAAPVGQVFVHRYLVWLNPAASNSVVIVDPSLPATPANNQIVAQVNPGMTITNSNPPLQLAFANQGGVVIIGSNSNPGFIRAIDLTANPPAVIGTVALNTGSSAASSLAVSPDSKVVVVSDPSISGFRSIQINQTAPPYSNSFFGTVSGVNLVTAGLTGFGGPRGLTFANDAMLLICGQTSFEVAAIKRNPATNAYTFNPTSDVAATTRAGTGSAPVAIRLMPDHTRVCVSTLDGSANPNDLLTFYLAPEGFSLSGTAAGSGAPRGLGVAISPDSKTGVVADAFPGNFKLHEYFWVGKDAQFVGDTTPPNPLPSPLYHWFLTAIEPVAGNILAVGTDNSRLQLFRREGGAYYLLNDVTIVTGNVKTFALEFQQ